MSPLEPVSAEGSVPGVIRWFDDEEGWGVIDALEVPGGCFFHFSDIVGDLHPSPTAGENVRFTYEGPGLDQDGYEYRAFLVFRYSQGSPP